MKTISTTILALFFTFSIIAQTSITGPYTSGNWIKANSPYLIYGNITVHSDSLLNIEHGVEVVFQDEYLFTVEGNLQATGIYGDSILFTVQDTTGYATGSYTGWIGLKFWYTADFSMLNYCIVEYSKGFGVYGEESDIKIDNSNIKYNSTGVCVIVVSGLEINNSIIEKNRGDGLYIHYYSSLNATNVTCRENSNNGTSVVDDCNAILNNFYSLNNGGTGMIVFKSLFSFIEGSVSDNLDGGFAIDESNTNLQDLTIQGNNKNGNGGGIYCDYGGSVNGTNLLIQYNIATEGGGIYATNQSNIILDSATIYYNQANVTSGSGGGIYIDRSTVSMSNSSINSCVSFNGGGIYIVGIEYEPSYFTGSNLILSNNTATSSGGGLYCLNNTHIVLDSTTLNINHADLISGNGGGLYMNTGTLASSNSSVLDCQAWKGGGIYIKNTISDLDNMIINNCQAEDGGGLYLFLEDIQTSISYSQLTNNNASNEGGGIYVYQAPAFLSITNTTMYNNQAGNDGNALITYSPFVEPSLKNCIVWGHNEPAISSQGGASLPTISYSDIQGTGIYPGTGNINQDPLFVDPNNGNFHLSWANPPYSWGGKSPCIDKGDPISPLDPDGTRTDMGAYYYHQTFTSISGNINDTLKCSESPYYVFGDLTIPLGEELVIEPCVHLVFMDDYRLNVEGQLQANGNSTDYIWFYPVDTDIGWQGIRFLNQNTNGQDSSRLEYCKIKYAKADGPDEDSKGGGIYCNNSSELLIKKSELSYNSAEMGGGIYCDSLSNPLISENVLEYNQALSGGGIYGDSSSFQLEDCYIRYNTATDKGGGIYVRAASSPLITDNIINWNDALSGGGIYADSSNCQVSSCFVQDNPVTEKGGGIYCYGGSPVFSSDTILSNHAILGGGIYGDSSNFQLDDCFFRFNTATDKGGGIYIYASNIQITDIYINQNQATNGGGMYSDSCVYQITGGEISGNLTEDNGGGIYLSLGTANISGVQFNSNEAGLFANLGRGGAIYCGGANLMLSDLYFTNNVGPSGGGGIFSYGSILNLNNVEFSFCEAEQGYGGGMWIGESPDCNLTDVTISNCYGDWGGGGLHCSSSTLTMLNVEINDNICFSDGGGGLHCSSSTLTMLNVEINDNIDGGYEGGGGLYCSSSTLSMLNVEINGNNSESDGGGIYLASSELTSEYSWICDNSCYGFVGGGGIYMDGNSSMDVINTTFSNNSSISGGSGGALYAESGSSANISNSIVWDHLSPTFAGTGIIIATYSDIQEGWFGAGNINKDPLFIDPVNGDFNLSWGNFPINDTLKSPCIDTGDPFSPLDPDSTRVDMGAFYHHYDLTPFNPVISSILDVPNDQGKQVVITWDKSPLDDDIYNVITKYSLWRLQNWAKTPWEYIGETPAHFFDEYAYIAPTISDSTAAGVPYFTYLVSAETADPFIFYNSLPDSGYSVDNLAPEPLENLYGYQEEGYVVLTWNASVVEDFDFYAIYKTNDLLNFPDDPFVTLTETTYIDQLGKSDSLYYYVTAFDINGNESGASDTIGIQLSKFVNIKVFFEGPFWVSQMIPYLNMGGYIPLSQPYNQPPWNYTGDEMVTQIPGSNIVDWVLLEFRDTTEAGLATSNTRVKRIAAFLKSDGFIVGLDGTNPPKVNLSYSNNLYLVVWHRNHLGIMSALPVDETSGSYSYDFTHTPDNIFGGDKAVKFLNAGMWGMNAADANADGQIDNKDKNDYWLIQLYNTGYYSGDFNMDTDVDLIDKDNFWKSNSGKSSFVPE